MPKTEIKELTQLIEMLDTKRSDNYNDWLTVGMIIKYNSNDYKLFESFSKRSKKFNARECKDKWNSLPKSNGKLTIGTLKYFARTDNKDAYDELYKTEERILTPNQFYAKFGESLTYDIEEDDDAPTAYDIYRNNLFITEQALFETININQRYILEKDTEITKSIKQLIKQWYTTDQIGKVLAIKSAYGTGKSDTMHYVIEEFKPKKVLFVTYRQTLSYNFYGNFEKHKVGCYLTGDFKSDRLICQVESLHKLLSYNNFTGKNIVPEYDLVIFDESESVLAHTDSNTIKNKDKCFKIMQAILTKAKKVVALDGDLANRSYEYLRHINNKKEFKVIKNSFVPIQKHWHFTNSKDNFDNKILTDLNNGYRLFIVCMASESASKYYDLLKDKYKVLVHSSKTDDELKQKLQTVNEYWINYDCVIITPTVEAGVDFNVKHFNAQYIVLSTGSTSQRGLNQMTSRVRHFTDNNVDVHLNGLPYKELATLYSKEEVDVMFDNEILRSSLNLDIEEEKEEDLFITINKYNYWENLHKNPAYFVPYLIKLLGSKGQIFSFDETVHKRKKETNLTKETILQAKDITKEESIKLIKLQEKNKATQEDKVMLERYFYKSNWELDELDRETLSLIYRKTHIMYNNKAINNQPLRSYESIDVDYKDIDVLVKKRKLDLVNQLLCTLKFKDVKNNFTDNIIPKETFEKLMTKAQTKCELFTNKSTLALFELAKNKIETTKAFLGFSNSILKNYGICISSRSFGKGMKKVEYKIVQDKIYKNVNELLTANEYYAKFGDEIETGEDEYSPYEQYLLSKKMIV